MSLAQLAARVAPAQLGEEFVLGRASALFRLERYGAVLRREGGRVILSVGDTKSREALSGVAGPLEDWLRRNGLNGPWRLSWRVG
jgi:hypothetical protein